MKKALIVFMGLLLSSMMAYAENFKENTHYTIIDQTGATQPGVLEFFSYLCPHCYNFEPIMEKVKKHLPEGVPFKKNHVQFIGRQMGVELSRAFAVSTFLKVEDAFTQAMFTAIHTEKRSIANVDDIKSVFAQVGINNAKYDSTADSFPVSAMMSQMKGNTQTFDIRSTPALVVNGKYKVESGSVRSLEEYLALINFLVAKVN